MEFKNHVILLKILKVFSLVLLIVVPLVALIVMIVLSNYSGTANYSWIPLVSGIIGEICFVIVLLITNALIKDFKLCYEDYCELRDKVNSLIRKTNSNGDTKDIIAKMPTSAMDSTIYKKTPNVQSFKGLSIGDKISLKCSFTIDGVSYSANSKGVIISREIVSAGKQYTIMMDDYNHAKIKVLADDIEKV